MGLWRYYLLTALLSLSFFSAKAQEMEFRSSLLEDLSSKAFTLSPDILGNRSVITEFDDAGRVANIGLDVFGTEDLDLYSGDICRFIERYFLELLCWDKTTVEQKLFDDKVTFVVGSPYDVVKLDNSYSFNLSLVDENYYTASWSKGGKTCLSIQFPVQYELLLGMTQVEMENAVQRDLTSQSPYETVPEVPEAEMLEEGIYRSIPVSHYLLKNLNDCTYYIETANKDFSPLFDEDHPAESLANLFQLNVGPDFKISVTQSLYGFKSRTYGITVSQWRSYCLRHQLKTYFSIEKEDERSFQVFILCENKALAYNHVLSVVVPKTFVTDMDILLEAKLSAYIPTHNIAELYNTDELRKDE